MAWRSRRARNRYGVGRGESRECLGFKVILESFVALGRVHAPNAPVPKAIVDRIRQIEREIVEEHWQSRTKTRPLQLPGNGD
ncbi:MAG TPA: hypothetical protein VJW73_09125 [Gemmatimonadaceae bacterium]|nr:hypothetical protein [Gemmatimonadaceae bacterium]